MNKHDIAKLVADKAGVSQATSKDILEKTLEAIIEGLRADGIVQLGQLLRLRLVDVPAKPARKVRNPRTGEVIQGKAKPACKKVKVRVTPSFTSAVN